MCYILTVLDVFKRGLETVQIGLPDIFEESDILVAVLVSVNL